MNRTEAEDFVYKSYMKAAKYQKYSDKDANKRHPQFSRGVIRGLCTTPCAVVTGSKGKGSVASMISQILQTRLKVGLLTSPHIVDFCERFKVNGKDISADDFARHVEAVRDDFERIDAAIAETDSISPMGVQAAVALSYFNSEHTDFNVFECGKGAKYDDVNNVLHQYAVINSIFLEHTRELGDTVEAIAADKSHVITGEQRCAYVARQKESVLQVIRRRAAEMHVPLKEYGRDFEAVDVAFTPRGMHFSVVIAGQVYDDITVPLLGEHQARNCAMAMALCQDVLGRLDAVAVRASLAALSWPGRLEVVSSRPFMMLDACINRASCSHILQTLQFLDIAKCTVVIGIPDDKDFLGVALAMQEVAAHTVMTKSQNAHYVFTEKQIDALRAEGVEATWQTSIGNAIGLAKSKDLPVLILGTTSVVSEVKKLQLSGAL